ncbi:nitrate ABC transporter substrate-binding protein [Devosia geojensis]|uniref:Nitrate ABC transporter substrate-binding protein n=1 Tax=Devosia geojensis TaxID=443610 RepID=A0A0F5FDM9_9HYPH|nr:ABC transporter substrate-binding protein [Devosia geojensis]KKB06961.1 nitrate ABC transporter substrate-binding protein [Devosia geojensis]
MRDVIRLAASTTLALAALSGAAGAQELDEVTFATNWLAQAEHGGYYQAIADGTYAEYGLDVTIRPGGPQSPGQQLLATGQVDFYMGGMGTINSVKEGIPTMAVAAIFQKDPQILIAHPDSPFETLADMTQASKLILGQATFFGGFYLWMKANYDGFRDEQYEPYTFNPAPFIADPMSVQQGYLTSEPYEIERQTGWAPKVFLLADYGYQPYSTTIEAQTAMVEENPDLVQRFVDASIIGWYNYLYGDNTAANELIKADNPEMTDGQLAYSLEKMKEYEILLSGEAIDQGIGCMIDARWTGFYDSMVEAGMYEPGIDISKAYTTQFVCKGVGTDLAVAAAE